MIDKMAKLFYGRDVTIHSIRTLNELETFVYTSRGKAEASKGYNDDLVMSLAIGL